MRIVHIISTLNIGGAENFVVQLANEQSKFNAVTIIVTGITDLNKNYRSQIHNTITLYELGWTKKYNILQFIRLNSLLKRLMPERIFVHLHNPLYYIYGISFIQRKISYVHTIHSSFDNWKPILKYLNKLRLFNNKILHVCVAPTIYNSLKKNFPKLKTTVIRNGIGEHQLKRESIEIKEFWNSFSIKPKKGKRFLAIGNINRHKNYKLLSLSFDKIYSQYADAMCIQVGNEMDPILARELKKINTPNLFFAGSQNNAADFLLHADALIVSSLQEGMPIVILEALSMGVPIISTPAGGIKDIIVNGENGFITQDFEVSSLTSAILKFIESSNEDKKKMAKNARVCFEQHYEIQKISKIYQNKSA
ncbi:glycosyltransferase family 4 protein [Aquimarina sp. RZ0]|uniref:glycosyltransferase family 4 protein n=1 Tax=Aquimarina sp. RZ0 TaxID=2607730 RepID=UPI0011F1A0E6|nr:glycosyltransferase family 4 protein [Aquimarina sp. RZ0]KAA1244181.1 glycosyltransferase family 4 protein [Aquimarina sp. RZ0]